MPEKKQKEYLVVWKIDITAGDHREAAEIALDMQRDPGSLATVFDVYEQGKTEGHRVDPAETGKDLMIVQRTPTDALP